MPLCKSTKTGPWFVTIATDMETQKQYADEKEFAENAEKRTTQVTNLINARMNLSVQTVAKNTWQEETTLKMKCELTACWKNDELFKSWQEKTSLGVHSYPTDFRCNIGPEKKIKFNVWTLKKKWALAKKLETHPLP